MRRQRVNEKKLRILQDTLRDVSLLAHDDALLALASMNAVELGDLRCHALLLC